MISQAALMDPMDAVLHKQVLEDFDQMIVQLQADAIRNAADYMEDIGNGYYQMLAVDDLYEKADYMDGTKRISW